MKWETISPMSSDEYDALVRTLPPVFNRIDIEAWKEKHSNRYSTWTLGSIVGLHCQRYSKKMHWRMSSPQSVQKLMNDYLNAVEDSSEPGALIRVAYNNGVSPCLLSRLLLEKFKSDWPHVSLSVTELTRNPGKIPDTRLAEDVLLASLEDDEYGPFTEAIKLQVGVDFENYLKLNLKEQDLTFLDEDQMRKEGYDKTPDVKLQVPIAVDGCIVNWIESKALFGDRENHEGYLQNQFWSYWNRFGPGMVIYWFGFVKDLDNNREKGILLTTDFPKDYITLPRKVVFVKSIYIIMSGKDDSKSNTNKMDLGGLEEDDEFEEFPAEEWTGEAEDEEDLNVWQDNWDDDNVEDDFSVQLRAELEKQGFKMDQS